MCEGLQQGAYGLLRHLKYSDRAARILVGQVLEAARPGCIEDFLKLVLERPLLSIPVADSCCRPRFRLDRRWQPARRSTMAKCAFCGHASEDRLEVYQAHARICRKHPAYKLERLFARLRAVISGWRAAEHDTGTSGVILGGAAQQIEDCLQEVDL